MIALRQRWARIAVTLLPVVLAVAHVVGGWHLPFVAALDYFIYDTRMRATMPRTLDPRIVIVDIDDASLQAFGQWPWRRDQLAKLTTEVMIRQQAEVLGFDVLFVEPDASSGAWPPCDELAQGALSSRPDVVDEIKRLADSLDYDGGFARALKGQRVALGYYFTQTREPRTK